MNKNGDQKSWEIETLGEPTFTNPIEALHFVNNSNRVLLDTDSNDLNLINLERAGPRPTLYFEPGTVIAGIVTCGGLCPALNNVIRSLVTTLLFVYGNVKVIGFKYGYQGLNPTLSETMELTRDTVRDIHRFGGTILGTSRGPQPIPVMVEYMRSLGVQMLFTIGGDGTLRGSNAIAQHIASLHLSGKDSISVIGIPKTIDNDISFVEKTFGFETAVGLAQDAIMSAHEEARSAQNGIGIVKLMGRESGFIALHAALASGDVNILLLPEMNFTMDTLIQGILKRFKRDRNPHCLIVVSEGAGQDLCKSSDLGKDASGNPIFADIGVFLKQEIGNRLKALKHTIKYIDPSYTIRAAPANPADAAFAMRLGQAAVHASMAGKTAMIVGMINGQFTHIPICKACAYRKTVDVYGQDFQSFLDASGMSLDLVTSIPK